MSFIYWSVNIYGEFEKQYNPIGDELILVSLILLQTIITFLIGLYFIFKSNGESIDFKNLGLNILAIVISFIVYLEGEQLWLWIHTFYSKT
jgi:hypothetical protein